MSDLITINQYQPFLQDILSRIKSARYEMLKSVSKQTVLLYRDIWKSVSEKALSQWRGNAVVEQLSQDLQREFSGIRWFSARNIWRMKILYETYSQNEKLTPLVAEIGWVQNCMIIEQCKDDLEREYYLKKTKQMGRSKLDLKDKISKNFFQNQALAQHNFNDTVWEELKGQVAREFVDDYNIELINPDQPVSEKEIENAVVSNIVNFLSEMGGSFAFVGRQYKIELEEKEYFIDLLFFNFKLNCYVIFELKAREFDPKDMWQLQMYMQLVNKQIKQSHHNPSIGIIICKEKSRTVVEYMLEQAKTPVWVATFNNYKDIPSEYAQYLPSEEDIVKRFVGLN